MVKHRLVRPNMEKAVSDERHAEIFGKKGQFRATAPKYKARDKYQDAAFWDNLARKYMGAYILPKWNVLPRPDIVLDWMDKVGVSVAKFERVFGVTPAEFCSINQEWPLRAVIGLLLEIKYINRTKPVIG